MSSFLTYEKKPGAGMVILNPSGTHVLLVQDDRHNKWGFPKGRSEPIDIDLLATAVRETAEETGLLPDIHYKITRKMRMYGSTTCILAHALKSDLPMTSCEKHHVKRIEWVPFGDIKHRDINMPLMLWARKEKWF